ncbi:hypothetical protein [Kitasatospora sp. HPMI-4]
MIRLARESSPLVHHLLVDYAVKGAIVVTALVVLGLGAAVIWWRAGRERD